MFIFQKFNFFWETLKNNLFNKNSIENLLKRNYIYFNLIIIFLLSINFSLYLLNYYFDSSNDYLKTIDLGIQAFLMFLTTFMGIFIPLELKRKNEKILDRKSYALSLNFLWHEIHKNKHILEQIKLNYKFSQILKIANLSHLIPTLQLKFETICSQAEELSSNSYIAAQNAHAFRLFTNDDEINDVIQAYDNLKNFTLLLRTINEDIKLKRYVIEQQFDPLSYEEALIFRKQLSENIINGYQELLFILNQTSFAITTLDKRMDKISLKQNWIPRERPIVTEIP